MDGKLGLGKEFTFPTVIPNFLVHEVIGVRKEKERLTAVAAGCGPEPFLPFVNTFHRRRRRRRPSTSCLCWPL